LCLDGLWIIGLSLVGLACFQRLDDLPTSADIPANREKRLPLGDNEVTAFIVVKEASNAPHRGRDMVL